MKRLKLSTMTACHRAWVQGGVEELEALDDEDRVLGMLPREPFTLAAGHGERREGR